MLSRSRQKDSDCVQAKEQELKKLNEFGET